eukprot:698262_1
MMMKTHLFSIGTICITDYRNWDGSGPILRESIKDKPSYSKRDEYIAKYIENQSNKKHEYLDKNGRINMVPYPDTDEDTITSVRPPFNHIFENHKIEKEIQEARNLLPKRLREKKHIIAKKGDKKINILFL